MDVHERVVSADPAVRRAGVYESHYLKANAPDGSGALWLKHNVLAPAPGSAVPEVAEFWLVLWGREDGFRPRVWKQVVPLADVALDGSGVGVTSDVARLRPDAASGAMEDARWELTWRDELPPLRHLAADWAYTGGFPRKKLVTPSPRLRLAGSVTTGGRAVDVGGWVGHRGHNWGSEHAHRYAYGTCNLWDDGADLTVDGFTAKVRVGPVTSPWLTVLRGLAGGAPYGSGRTGSLLSQSGAVDWPTWTAYAGRHRDRIRLEMTLDPDHAAGLRYLHPDGRLSYCYNAKDARVLLLRGGARHTSTAGELEFLVPAPIAGVPLHGEGSPEELRAAAAQTNAGSIGDAM